MDQNEYSDTLEDEGFDQDQLPQTEDIFSAEGEEDGNELLDQGNSKECEIYLDKNTRTKKGKYYALETEDGTNTQNKTKQ